MKNYHKFGNIDKAAYYLGTLTIVSLTVWLFSYLNQIQPTYYIDEVFHIPQTIKYCERKYHEWDPKITTLPALYYLTSQLLKPFNLCNTVSIRSINLISTFINLYLITSITKFLHNVNENTPRQKRWIQIAMSYNITFLPPLSFWFFLFYTDVFSTTMVLSMLLLHIHGYFSIAAIPGAISILIRQTNIIWMLLLAAEYCLDKIDVKSKQLYVTSRQNNTIFTCTKRMWNYLLLQIFQGPRAICKLVYDLICDVWMYTLCGIMFIAFIIWNEGIVVGDRSFHQATFHLPQIFYFSVFSLLFAWPYMLQSLQTFIADVRKHLFISIFLLICILTVIHYNTLVHQYVLADNRHYVFYFWNKIMKRYKYFRYYLAPVYGFAMYAFYKCINHVKLSKLIAYLFCIFVVLVPQLLLEPRYFIVPYIFFRLNLKFPERWQILFETLTVLIINVGQFYLFVNKTFYWTDLTEPQRIGW